MAVTIRNPDATFGPFRERDSLRVAGTVCDDESEAIPGSDLTTMVYSLYDEASPQTLVRDHVDMKSLVGSDGAFVLELTPADGAFVGTNIFKENHRILFEWTWSAGSKRGSWEVRLRMENVLKVP